MSSISGKAFDFKLFKRVFRYVVPYKKVFVLTAFLTITSAILGPVRPYLIQYAIDKAVMLSNAPLLLKLTLLMIGVLILEGIVQFYQTFYSNWLGQTVIKDLRMDVYKAITKFKLKYFDRNPVGTLVTRSVSDIETISDIFSQGILIIIGDILKLVVIIAVMFATNWKLALISMISMPLLIIATNMFKNYIKAAFQDVRTEVSKLNTFVQEHISGMAIVQIFNREEIELKKFQEINKRHMEAHIRTVHANSIFFPVVEILSAISIAALVWYGAGSIVEGALTFGELTAFILYIYMLFRPIRQLADRFNTLQLGMVSSERVFKVIDTNEYISNTGNIEKNEVLGEIEFKDVWFAYNEEEWVLKNLTFSAKKGEMVAFVGATGAGKTSVINILSRFYEYNKGSICLDGVNIRDYKLDNLLKHIGVVLQDVFLFSDSILNNITLGNPNISKDQVIEASKAVGAHDFIVKLPGDYDFNVKERGAILSAGQRQLLAFIRAYVYNPSILVLDEATSSVDTESEELIQQATEVLTAGRTSIIIAHRLSTIQKADRILVMDKGRVLEQGNHQELLALGGQYKKLYEMQFSEVED